MFVLQAELGAESLQGFAERVVKITAVDKSAAVVPVFEYESPVGVVIVKNTPHFVTFP